MQETKYSSFWRENCNGDLSVLRPGDRATLSDGVSFLGDPLWTSRGC